MRLELKHINVPPGQRVLFHNISWQDFEAILEDLGEHRAARVAYNSGILEIMTPLPEHERNKVLISNFVEALLEELEIDFWCLGSTTFKNQAMLKGIEPDNCFYITNEALVRGKNCLDLEFDPPPDLALEIDVTARTHLNTYTALGVPELWRFEKGKLEINALQNGKYVAVEVSPTFPEFPLRKAVPEFLQRCKTEGRNQTMKAFRVWVDRCMSGVHVRSEE